MKDLKEKASVVVYKEDVNDILRGLYSDLKRYFRCLNTNHVRTNTGFQDLTFSHWFFKLQSRHFCRKPIKRVSMTNDYVVDGRSFGNLIPFEENRVIRLSKSDYGFLFEYCQSMLCKLNIELSNTSKDSKWYTVLYEKYNHWIDIQHKLQGWLEDYYFDIPV